MKRNTKVLTALIIFLFAFQFHAWARDDDGQDYWYSDKKNIASSAAQIEPLAPGDQAPYGTLRAPDGQAIDLEGFLAKKPTILIFDSSVQSSKAHTLPDPWTKVVPQLISLGFQVAVILPYQPLYPVPENLNYVLLFDRTMDVTRRFGLAYYSNLPKTKFNLHRVQPVPAVLGIDTKKIIRFIYFYPNKGFWDQPDRLLKAWKNLIIKYP